MKEHMYGFQRVKVHTIQPRKPSPRTTVRLSRRRNEHDAANHRSVFIDERERAIAKARRDREKRDQASPVEPNDVVKPSSPATGDEGSSSRKWEP